MPKSKRNKVVSLTRTGKKGKEKKSEIVNTVRQAVEEYKSVYVFSYENMRTALFKDVRIQWRESKFILAKLHVMKLALGRNVEEEVRENLSKISDELHGQRGLLFTNESEEAVKSFFSEFVVKDYARTGAVATETIEVDEGPLEHFPHSMEIQFRNLGLPVRLERGVITVERKHRICKKGETLSPEQAKLLKLFDIKLSEFKLELVALWCDGEFELYN